MLVSLGSHVPCRSRRARLSWQGWRRLSPIPSSRSQPGCWLWGPGLLCTAPPCLHSPVGRGMRGEDTIGNFSTTVLSSVYIKRTGKCWETYTLKLLVCVRLLTVPPIALGAWLMALVLWQPPEYYNIYCIILKFPVLLVLYLNAQQLRIYKNMSFWLASILFVRRQKWGFDEGWDNSHWASDSRGCSWHWCTESQPHQYLTASQQNRGLQ